MQTRTGGADRGGGRASRFCHGGAPGEGHHEFQHVVAGGAGDDRLDGVRPAGLFGDRQHPATDVSAQQLTVVWPAKVQGQAPVGVLGDDDVGRGRSRCGPPGV